MINGPESGQASPAPLTNPAPQGRRRLLYVLLSLGALIAAVIVRLIDLDRKPGELYGDISIVFEYMLDIRRGGWPTYFVLSAGPLYHYAIAPIVSMVGLSYFGLKVASVVISLLVLVVLYALARLLQGDELALLSLVIGGVSSWLLIFSRLGNSQIIIPLLALGAIYFAVRLARSGDRFDAAACAIVSALGLYTYPQTFVLPPVMFLTLVCLALTRTAVRREHLLIFALVTIPCAIPFGLIVARDPGNFFTGYIGGKLETASNPLITLAGNVWRALRAFHLRGDTVFRSNPADLPHLDTISGFLFLAGIVYWLRRGRRQFSPALFVPFLLLQVPSMLVLSYPDEVPSASRTIAVAPIAYLLAASGLWGIYRTTYPLRWPGRVLVMVILVLISYVNLQRYFQTYIAGLPDGNTPFGRIIAEYIDQLPDSTTVYVVGCCWSVGQPEPKSILYSQTKTHTIEFFDGDKITCDILANTPRPAVVIWNPGYTLPAPQLNPCAELFDGTLHTAPPDYKIFYSSELAAP